MPDLHSIHGQRSLIVAVGDAGSIWHLTPTACSIQPPVTKAHLLAVCIRHPTDGWAVGEAGIIRTDALVNSIYIDEAGQAYCLCASREVFRLDGDRWRRDQLPGDNEDDEFCQLAGCGHGPVYAVGVSGKLQRFDGHRWHQVPIHTHERFTGAACRHPDELWLTTSSGQLLRWDGQQLRTCASSPFGWLGAVYAAPGQQAVYCCGGSITILRHWPRPPQQD